MSKKSRRRKKGHTGLLSWFRSQQNITKIVYWIVAFIFIGGAFVGFGGSLGGSGGGGGCSQSGGQQLNPEQRAWLSEIVATVGGNEITRGDLESKWGRESDQPNRAQEEGIYVPPPEESYIRRWQVLDGMMMQSLIEQEAGKMGLAVEQKEIDEQVAQVKEQFLGLNQPAKEKRSLFQRIGDSLNRAKSAKAYESILWDRMQLTPEQLENEIKQYVLQSRFLEAFQEEVQTELDDEGKEKADMVRGKLDEGADFATLVEEYSDDRAPKEDGGLVEDVNRTSDQSPEIIDMAFSMAVGEISPPFKVTEKMDFGQGQPYIFEYYVIIELLEKRTASDEDIDAELDDIREIIREEKWETEKVDNPDILLEDIDVSDEEIAEEYDKVSYRMIKIESSNISLQSERAEEKIAALRDEYEMKVIDPQLTTWAKVRDSEFEAARDEWALYAAEVDSYLEDPEFLSLSEEEQEDKILDTNDRNAQINYVSGLLYRIQIMGYQSQYGLSVTGEKEEKRRERWEAYNEDPEAYGEDEPDLQEPTEEEKEHYRQLNEEALPYFDLALEVIQEDAHMFLHRGETNLDLGNYEAALDDFEEGAIFASRDLRLNSGLENDVSQLLSVFEDEVNAERVRVLMDQLSETVASIQEELRAIQEQMQAQQQAGGMVPQQ